MSLGNDAQWYLAALAGNNGNAADAWAQRAKEWEAYAHRLEQQTEKLQGDVVEWQAAAVAVGAKGLMYKEIIQTITGNNAAEVIGSKAEVDERIKKFYPDAKARLGADLVDLSKV